MTNAGSHKVFRAMIPPPDVFVPGASFAENQVFQLAVGGHRGNGANVWDADGPREAFRQRENTISSMLAAVEAGATFVEFDVQVTRDGQVVIFHDNFLVMGDEANPASHLIADMELEQFKGASPVNSVVGGGSDLEGASDDEVMSSFRPMSMGHPRLGNAPTGIEDRTDDLTDDRTDVNDPFLVAGTSPDGSSPSVSLAMTNRNGSSKLLRQHRNGIVASASDKSLQAWTVADDDEFPTLLEVWGGLPAHVGFDIEIKMATPDDVAVTPLDEILRMVDPILRTVEIAEARDEGQGRPRRPLLFSSFDPDVVDLVKRRRPNDWVMFLSTGGTSYHADPRRMSIDAAIEVAVLAGLQGVIIDSGSLMLDQGAVARARAEGLLVMTYGGENDEVAWVGTQKTLGVHGVIVDDVAKMRAAFLMGA